ncbi:MAG: hypothetical protein EBV10_11670 [Synechococcaceae bacterium WB6_1A_059]|nr:hypothetical protein [Synechococcaceae bacterium WB6_1A_059]
MNLDVNDILYTPLDVSDKPKFSLPDIEDWINLNHNEQKTHRNFISNLGLSGENKVLNYPWNLTFVYYNIFEEKIGWLGNFDTEFPILAEYFYRSFNLEIEDIGTIIFLPISQNHTGLGFWHNDPDSIGMRHYLAFEHPNINKLLLRKTKIPYSERPNINLYETPDLVDDKIYECKVLHPMQSFYLNNVRAVHATQTNIINSKRLAVLVVGKKKLSKCSDLIIRSALKYKNYSIFY